MRNLEVLEGTIQPLSIRIATEMRTPLGNSSVCSIVFVNLESAGELIPL
jgi:hypothetical protein